MVLGGRRYKSPYRSAGAWLEILEVTALDSLTLAALTPEDRWDVQERMLDGEIRAPELAASAQVLLKEATGYERWWIGYRLAVAALDPAILGSLVLAGR